MDNNSQVSCGGRFRFKVYDSITGEFKRETDWIKNKIVSSNDYGLNIICQHLSGVTTLPLEITQAKIGTGTTPTTLAMTDLEVLVVSNIIRANQSVTNNSVVLEFFIPDADIPNGTYTEFGIFSASQMFARAIISPSFTKSTNEDLSCEYEITFTSI